MITSNHVDEDIRDLVDHIRNYESKIQGLERHIDSLKAVLHDRLQMRAMNWSDSKGYARITAEEDLSSYDVKALDKLIITDPVRYGWLGQYRTKSTIPSKVQVK